MPKTNIIAVGGYGDFVLSNIYDELKAIKQLDSVISINTDSQSQANLPEGIKKLNISNSGHGAGGKPEVAYELAQSHKESIRQSLEGGDIAFLVLGLGKGTGTGAGLAVAEFCKELGIYTVACLRTPEEEDGEYRCGIAREYGKRIGESVDAICTISNQTVLEHGQPDESISKAYARGNQAAFDSIRGLISIVENCGERNVDLEDFKATIQGKFAITVSTAEEVQTDFSLFDLNAKEARTSLSVVEYPSQSQASLSEVMGIKSAVREALNPEANKIDGLIANPHIEQTQLILVVSGFEKTLSDKRREAGLKGLQIRYQVANSSKTESEEVTALQTLAN